MSRVPRHALCTKSAQRHEPASHFARSTDLESPQTMYPSDPENPDDSAPSAIAPTRSQLSPSAQDRRRPHSAPAASNAG